MTQRGRALLHPSTGYTTRLRRARELEGIEMGIERTIVSVRLVGPCVVELCGRVGRVEVSWSKFDISGGRLA